MKKIVVKLHIHDGKAKKKAMKAVSTLEGITSLSADSSAGKLTVTGDVDPVAVVGKLRCKKWVATIDSVEDVKKDEKKDDGKKKEEEKKDDGKKKDINEQLADYVKAYQNAYPHLTTHYYVQSMEENPNACVIC